VLGTLLLVKTLKQRAHTKAWRDPDFCMQIRSPAEVLGLREEELIAERTGVFDPVHE
jgi:hypothetical protein